ncbi:hypothetical protein [Streptomyces sp. NPDC006551]|uniref:hypothetical protein n=1 Tax=Streptomyces sp. NPDC006551 TaxID=3157178 RepID=UPI0033AC371E
MNAKTDETAAPGKSAADTVAPLDDDLTADDLTADDADDALTDDLTDEADDEASPGTSGASGLGAGAAAVVSAALGVAALTGTWTGKIAAEREALIGQIKASQGGSTAQQISEIYGDAWHATALVNGVFAFLALITAVLVLVLTRPGRPAWVRAVAVAGAVLGGIGLLLSGAMYFDLLLGLPTATS